MNSSEQKLRLLTLLMPAPVLANERYLHHLTLSIFLTLLDKEISVDLNRRRRAIRWGDTQEGVMMHSKTRVFLCPKFDVQCGAL